MYFIAITLCACGNSELENNVVQDSQQDLSSPELAYNESIGDSILPYFEFDEQGNKIQIFQNNNNVLKKEVGNRKLVLDSLSEFLELETYYANRLANDPDYSRTIKRPLDYVCPTSWLAMSEDYNTITLANGDTLLSDKILFSNCEYTGFSCDDCDDSSDKDPYLDALKVQKKSVENTDFDSKVTVEIYPYKMIASSFVTNVKYVYSSAGSETYFQKRQRVWRGPFKGMVWRWAAFDPDRNGIRTYCFNKCKYEESYGGLISSFECSETRHATDLDTCCDTEDITVRCKLSFPFQGGIQVSVNSSTDNGVTMTPINKLEDLKEYTNDPSVNVVTEYNGAVIGMHYVRHGNHEFRAKTSKNAPADLIKHIKQKYTLSYR
ncbi:hypothetical protein [Fibrobacter sp. UWB5]|uniref:hypothetical protein n=1 Tax=Fibrobacter sp. UWB5 TaxID=1964360 RepID=UPI000B52499B|nr:hypothetical protein [Fibrobacter sp. UWB5]OWV11387.1 hypothetical protein B7989_10115 [Fibrobacter sp. UWB5]